MIERGRLLPDADRSILAHSANSMSDRVRPIVLKKSVHSFFRFPAKKLTSQIDLPTARASVKGKKTPENLAGKTVDDCFFNRATH